LKTYFGEFWAAKMLLEAAISVSVIKLSQIDNHEHLIQDHI